MEIHAVNKLHLGSVLYLQYGGNATGFPPFPPSLLLFTMKVFRGRGYRLPFTDTPQWEFITVGSLDATQVAKGESSK